ncbi:MAG TPA: response regulator [Candidatus Methylacidiphilales bacterium]
MILVVEDNADDSFLLTRQLARAHLEHRVRVIGDGKDALEFLLDAQVHVEVVFLDLTLPRMSGIEILRQIRSDERRQGLSIIVMTNSVNPSDVRECTALGVTAYLPKPVDLKTFARIVGHLDVQELGVSKR